MTLELVHLLFDQLEIALGDQMQASLEGQVPLLRGPVANVLEAIGDVAGTDVIAPGQGDVGPDVETVREDLVAAV